MSSKERSSMVFYKSFWDAVKGLPDEERLAFYEALFAYGLEGEEVELSVIGTALFKLAAPVIKKDYQQYQNGVKGGRPKNPIKTQPKPNNNPTITQPKPGPSNDEDEDVDKDVDKDEDGEGMGFTAATSPTLEDVVFYFDEIGSSADPERFFEYYGSEALGNMDWHSKAEDWKKTQYSRKSKKPDWEKELEEWAKEG